MFCVYVTVILPSVSCHVTMCLIVPRTQHLRQDLGLDGSAHLHRFGLHFLLWWRDHDSLKFVIHGAIFSFFLSLPSLFLRPPVLIHPPQLSFLFLLPLSSSLLSVNMFLNINVQRESKVKGFSCVYNPSK